MRLFNIINYNYELQAREFKFDNRLETARIIFSEPNHHGDKQSNGMIIRWWNKILYISGDTKASSKHEKKILDIAKQSIYDDIKFFIYHDFSFWNAPSKNVHTCEADFWFYRVEAPGVEFRGF